MEITSRYFANPAEPLRSVDAHRELLASLDRINTHNPPVQTCSTGWSFGGLYTGPTSVAYLFFQLSRVYPDLEFKQQSLLEWAKAYLNLGTRAERRPPIANHCGISDETLAHLAVSAVVLGDSSFVKELCSYSAIINSPSDVGSNEWLYGRAGYLYYLRLCRKVYDEEGHTAAVALLDETIKTTVNRVMSLPQPWLWHGTQYLGAAHGTIGIICQLILSDPSTAPKLENLLSSVLEQQFESGNFVSSYPPRSDRLVQFCHGGPGFVISLRSIIPYFPALREKIQKAVSDAQSNIWERGLLTKEPCLCHGIAGNALALDDDRHFAHFLSFMDSEALEKRVGHTRRDADAAGLYTGETGRAWAWAVADRGLPKTCIAYNDL
ncbi:hypothetical protein F4809DRAFT_600000 [Biscogniauxia mediterranea]|nr:hypothetical protein F4809DRAFT_600000 [Biscogniauxia mediterranea]